MIGEVTHYLQVLIHLALYQLLVLSEIKVSRSGGRRAGGRGGGGGGGGGR